MFLFDPIDLCYVFVTAAAQGKNDAAGPVQKKRSYGDDDDEDDFYDRTGLPFIGFDSFFVVHLPHF
jgi:hypothetical protein